MSQEQYVCIEHLQATLQVANCCQSWRFLPAALTSATARRRGGPCGAFYRDREERALRFEMASWSEAHWEKFRQYALARLEDRTTR